MQEKLENVHVSRSDIWTRLNDEKEANILLLLRILSSALVSLPLRTTYLVSIYSRVLSPVSHTYVLRHSECRVDLKH